MGIPRSQHTEWFVFNHSDVLVECSLGWKLCSSTSVMSVKMGCHLLYPHPVSNLLNILCKSVLQNAGNECKHVFWTLIYIWVCNMTAFELKQSLYLCALLQKCRYINITTQLNDLCVTHNDLRQCAEDAVQFECIHNYYRCIKRMLLQAFSQTSEMLYRRPGTSNVCIAE